jgi:hypothetical protein
MIYTLYFEIFGKKMKTSIEAKTREEAKHILFSKIVFHKIEMKKRTDLEEAERMFEQIFKK